MHVTDLEKMILFAFYDLLVSGVLGQPREGQETPSHTSV